MCFALVPTPIAGDLSINSKFSWRFYQVDSYPRKTTLYSQPRLILGRLVEMNVNANSVQNPVVPM